MYVIFFSPIVILIGGEITGVKDVFGLIPLLSVAVGILHVTIIELSLLGKVNMELFGQLFPNEGGSVSEKSSQSSF